MLTVQQGIVAAQILDTTSRDLAMQICVRRYNFDSNQLPLAVNEWTAADEERLIKLQNLENELKDTAVGRKQADNSTSDGGRN